MTDTPERPDTSGIGERPRVVAPEGIVRNALWHPQWGGYAAPCVVEFHQRGLSEVLPEEEHGPPYDLPCFDVWEWQAVRLSA